MNLDTIMAELAQYIRMQEEGACCTYDAESGEFVRDEDMCVFVTEL